MRWVHVWVKAVPQDLNIASLTITPVTQGLSVTLWPRLYKRDRSWHVFHRCSQTTTEKYFKIIFFTQGDFDVINLKSFSLSWYHFPPSWSVTCLFVVQSISQWSVWGFICAPDVRVNVWEGDWWAFPTTIGQLNVPQHLKFRLGSEFVRLKVKCHQLMLLYSLDGWWETVWAAGYSSATCGQCLSVLRPRAASFWPFFVTAFIYWTRKGMLRLRQKLE